MKRKLLLKLYIVIIATLLIGCSRDQGQNISLEVWHYYNGAQKLAFDEYIEEFNETKGLEEGIIIEAFSQGNISELGEKTIDSVKEKVGASETPDMVAIYPETAYKLDQYGVVVNLDKYLEEEEIEQYLESYLEEGRLGKKNELKIFPTAKATEVMMVNKTDWEKFAAATGASTEDLTTWEGVRKTAESYYNWTDGKAFFGRDALANYVLVGSKQLGKELFEVKQDKVEANLDQEIMRKLWDNYYIPYVSGYYTTYGRFSTDDAKIGEIIALVGSTTGATYFPDNVTIGDDDSYNIELMVLPLPNFENKGLDAIQQGAGIAVLKSDQASEKASVEFLKWFTEESRNFEFSIKTGYLPVKKSAYETGKAREQYIQENKASLSQQLQLTIPLAIDQVEEYDLYVNKAFDQSDKLRKLVEVELKNKLLEDREKFLELENQGMSHEQCVVEFASDEKFKMWLLEFEEKVLGVIKDEE